MIRTQLLHASVPPTFWPFALSTSTYLHNILPQKLRNYLSPTYLLYHVHPTFDHLRVFGCLCYPLTPFSQIHKLHARSTPCVFLGYPKNSRGYLCYDRASNKFLISRHVIFDEHCFPYGSHSQPSSAYDFLDDSHSPYIISQFLPTIANQPNPSSPQTRDCEPTSPGMVNTSSGQPSPTNPSSHTTDSTNPSTLSIPRSRQSRLITHPMTTRSKVGTYKPRQLFNLNTQQLSPIPRNPKEALDDPNWRHAMLDEYNALIQNKTWTLVPRPRMGNVVRCHWIYRVKTKSDGSFERYKARLVADGRS